MCLPHTPKAIKDLSLWKSCKPKIWGKQSKWSIHELYDYKYHSLHVEGYKRCFKHLERPIANKHVLPSLRVLQCPHIHYIAFFQFRLHVVVYDQYEFPFIPLIRCCPKHSWQSVPDCISLLIGIWQGFGRFGRSWKHWSLKHTIPFSHSSNIRTIYIWYFLKPAKIALPNSLLTITLNLSDCFYQRFELVSKHSLLPERPSKNALYFHFMVISWLHYPDTDHFTQQASMKFQNELHILPSLLPSSLLRHN